MKKLLLSLLMVSSYFASGQVILAEEGFEGDTFPPAGWTTINTNATNNWDVTDSANFTITGNQSAFVQWIAEDQEEWLISPTFSLAGQTSAYLNFSAILGYEYMVDPNPNGDLFVKISTDGGQTWTDLWVEEDQGLYTDYDVLSISLDLAPYLGNANCKIAFSYVAFDADSVSIDDVSVTGCSTVKDLAFTALTDTSASFTWDPQQVSYDIDFGLVALAQGAGTITNQTEGAINFSSLTPGTGYRFYIRTNCDGGATGPWEGPFNFYTNLLTPTQPTYVFGFEEPTLGMAGWTSTAGTGGSWGLSGNGGDATLVQDGTGLAFCSSSTTVATSDYLFSRGLTLQAGEIITINYYIRKFNVAGTSAQVRLRSKIGTAATVAGATTTLLTHNNFTNQTYALQTTTFTAPAAGTYFIAFECYSPVHTTAARAFVLLDALTVTSNLSNNEVDLLSGLSVFPNPSNDVFNVSNQIGATLENVTISDLNGRVVKSQAVNAADTQVNVSDLSAGVYMMNITSDKGTATKKVVKN